MITMSYKSYDPETASTVDRAAWVLCQIIDDNAPMGWTRYRFFAECIATNPRLMEDLKKLAPPVGAAIGEKAR